MKKNCWKKVISAILLSAVMAAAGNPASAVYAADKKMSLAQAEKLALANSESYVRIKSRITLKEAAYEQAVKAAGLKVQNNNSYRWSPLLSFRLPEEMDFQEESSLILRPVQLQTQIRQLEYSLMEETYKVYEEAGECFFKVYLYQEKTALWEMQLEELNKAAKKSRGRVILGLTDKEDVEALEESIQTTEEKMIRSKKELILAKERLSELLGIDVSVRYTFSEPEYQGMIPRSAWEGLLQYTLENDSTIYNARLETGSALIRMQENYALLEKKYPTEISLINSYVQQIKEGKETDYDSFKTSYDLFLENIAKNTEGEEKISSISVPKEWLIGETSGIRYVEDQPYAVYENALEYKRCQEEEAALKKELEAKTAQAFENLTTAENEYKKQQTSAEKKEKELKKKKIMYSLGELSYEEYQQFQTQYREQENLLLDALEEYWMLYFQLDCFTCGGLTEYGQDSETFLKPQEGREHWSKEGTADAEYYFQSLIEDNMFEFGIYLKNPEIKATAYELYAGEYMIGKKTAIGTPLRHLTLTLTGEERIYVRLYNGEEFLKECDVDPRVYQGSLSLNGEMLPSGRKEEQHRIIGTYEKKEKLGLMELKIQINSGENVQYYGLQTENGKELLTTQKKKTLSESFLYLSLMPEEISSLKISLYDKDMKLKHTAFFDTEKYNIYVIEEQEGTDRG